MGAIDGNEGYEVDFIARGVIRGLGRPVILAAWNLNAFRFTRGRGGGVPCLPLFEATCRET